MAATKIFLPIFRENEKKNGKMANGTEVVYVRQIRPYWALTPSQNNNSKALITVGIRTELHPCIDRLTGSKKDRYLFLEAADSKL